jgi:probable F420-dependent oxidoreductase
VRFGVTAFVNDTTIGIAEVATTVEELGFESLWLGEHDHLPVATVHPWVDDGRPPDVYRRFPNPFVVLAHAAAVTTRLRLGTSVTLVAEHDPLYQAKEVATLDWLSGGRVELGVGYGWNALELANHGVDPGRRRSAFREKVAAMKALWTDETAAFDGEFVRFDESWSWPKPVQRPHPPISIGAALTPATRRDIVALADGWMPIRSMLAPDELTSAIGELRQAFDAEGRDPASCVVTLLELDGSLGGKRSIEAFEQRLPDEPTLRRYEAIGVDRCVFGVPAHDHGLFHAAAEALADRIELVPRG